MNTIFNYSTTAKEDVELVAKNVRPHGLLYGQLVLVPARNFATELRTPRRARNITFKSYGRRWCPQPCSRVAGTTWCPQL